MSACQSTPVVTPKGTDLAMADADALLRQAAQTSGRQATDLRIFAARVLVFNGDHQRAIETLAPLSLDALEPSQRDAAARTLAAALLEAGRSNEAEPLLGRIGEFGSEDLLLLGRVCQAKGDYRCSADAYIQASLTAGNGATWIPGDINDRIWLALSRARSAPTAFTDPDHHAWWLLQERIRTAGSITGQLQAWRDWQNRYPSHPARLQPPLALRNLSDYQTPQIALMLPLSGTSGAAGTAVRDGLIAAYLTETGSDRPQVRIYDTAEVPIGQLYEQALREGANVMVGPLIRPEVEAFVELTQFSDVPRLVLNYLSTDVDQESDAATTLSPAMPTPLFQFGIAI